MAAADVEFGTHHLPGEGPGGDPSFNLRRLQRGVRSRLARGRKLLWQWRHLDKTQEKTPVFVVGCQRSGTTMLLQTIERCPYTWVYYESTNAAFLEGRLRSVETIRRVIENSYSRALVFKPLEETHLADQMLAIHPKARIIWVYRRYPDVANSATRRWGDHQKDAIRWIKMGEWDRLTWRGERLPAGLVELVSDLYSDDMSAEDAAALFWYLRNQFYFDLGLDENPRVMLVQYEDLVRDPQGAFGRVFSLLNCPLEPEHLESVFRSSIGKESFPAIEPRIKSLCEAMQSRFDERYQASVAS